MNINAPLGRRRRAIMAAIGFALSGLSVGGLMPAVHAAEPARAKEFDPGTLVFGKALAAADLRRGPGISP